MEHKEHVMGEDINISVDDIENLPIVSNNEDFSSELQAIEKEAEVSPLSPLELSIAEERLNNVSNRDIARRLGVSDKVVRIVLSRHHVRSYIKEVFEAVTTADKELRMQLMASMIENKMAEEGVTSKLDLAQLVQMLDSMGKVKEQADVGSQGSVMINILNTLQKD